MNGNIFAAVLFSLTGGASVAAAALWALKKAGAARRKSINPPAGFLAGTLIFVAVYGADRAFFKADAAAAALANVLAVAVLLALPWFKKKAKVVRQRDPRHQHLRAEVAALERMLQRDPLNAFCHERLSELHEQCARPDLALQAARAAAELDPTVKNRLRVEELEARFPALRRGPAGLP